MRRIETSADIDRGLDALCAMDTRLERIRQVAGAVPLRRSQPGFASLVSIVVGQQVSRASADAILGRLTALVDPLTPQTLLAAGDEVHRAAGLSRGKQRALRDLAEAVEAGLDLSALCELPGDEAIARLTRVRGIGPWTAEVYLLVAAGHPDILPARDVALQAAVGHALALSPRPDPVLLAGIAAAWSPWRGVASRLFWAYYRAIRLREGAPPS